MKRDYRRHRRQYDAAPVFIVPIARAYVFCGKALLLVGERVSGAGCRCHEAALSGALNNRDMMLGCRRFHEKTLLVFRDAIFDIARYSRGARRARRRPPVMRPCPVLSDARSLHGQTFHDACAKMPPPTPCQRGYFEVSLRGTFVTHVAVNITERTARRASRYR